MLGLFDRSPARAEPVETVAADGSIYLDLYDGRRLGYRNRAACVQAAKWLLTIPDCKYAYAFADMEGVDIRDERGRLRPDALQIAMHAWARSKGLACSAHGRPIERTDYTEINLPNHAPQESFVLAKVFVGAAVVALCGAVALKVLA